MSYKLIISIVPHDSGEFISSTAKSAGAGGGSIIMGRGTAANSVLQLLGLGDTSKDIVYIVVDDSKKDAVLNAIVTASEEKKSHFGVLFTLDVGSFIKAGTQSQSVNDPQQKIGQSAEPQGTQIMQNENKGENAMYEMINVIVNKGYAEDAMAAARKAGAGGGTIIGARGTAREDDAAFFGMKIVPEKDMLIILVPTEKKDNIVRAITELPCFAEAGSGIVFCNEAKDFTLLGKK